VRADDLTPHPGSHHETIHDTLQVDHAQYYREDEGLGLPATTLKRVFLELAERR
jgi:hypothetical protein